MTDLSHDHAIDLLTRLLRDLGVELDLAAVNRNGLLQDELDLDSMDFLNLMTALFTATGIDVPERDYPKLATVDGFADYVGNRLAAA
jgi:acyl carrier protein